MSLNKTIMTNGQKSLEDLLLYDLNTRISCSSVLRIQQKTKTCCPLKGKEFSCFWKFFLVLRYQTGLANQNHYLTRL